MDASNRLKQEIVSAFWKIHILHHAGERPINGRWILAELRRHGYCVGPGALYPLLRRLEERGWLSSETDSVTGAVSCKNYTLTPDGANALKKLRENVGEMYREVVLHK